MKRSLIISLLLHAAIAGALFTGIAGFGERLPPEEAISVEIVEMSEVAEIATPPEPEPAEAAPLPPRQAASPAPPPPAPEPVAPEPPLAQPASEPPPPPLQAEPAPEPPPPPPPPLAPEPKLAEAPPPVPAPPPAAPPEPRRAAVPAPRPATRPEPPKVEAPPRPAPEPARQVAAKPETKPAPREPAATPPAADDFDALLRSVEKQTKRVASDERRAGTGRADVVEAGAALSREAGAVRLSMMEQAGIKRQIESCWNLVGVHVSAPIVVPLRIIMNPDGTPQRVEVQDQVRFNADAAYRAVAQSAQRAVLSCKLSLPPEKYAQWRDMVLNFNPQDALSG